MLKIAVDAVLLPSDEMMDKAIEASKKLSGISVSRILLSRENCLPHISLAMGVIDEQDLPFINEDLQQIAIEFQGIKLSAINISTHETVSGETVSHFEIKKTGELQLLHEKFMRKLSRYFTYDAVEKMLLAPEGVKKTTLEWINNYRKNSSFGKFSPHITIGYGKADNAGPPVRFTASRLALCHLGNHCTCRKILASAPISGE